MKASLRICALALCIAFALMLLPSCGGNVYTEGSGELRIVATTFVPFDLARSVTGAAARITLLQDNGSDLHDYSPTVSALSELNQADIFICVGGVSDEWVSDAVNASENSDLKVIRLTELCEGVLSELEGHTHSEYCEANHTHDHGDHAHSEHDGHGHVSDEHVWTSLENASVFVNVIAEACAEKDPQNADLYRKNASDYTAAICELDALYRVAVTDSRVKTLAVADRFPYIYMTHSLGLCHYAAFSGCSGEIDADFETAVRLTEAVKESGLSYVIVTEASDLRLAKTVQSATGCGILTLHSLQNVTRKDIEAGATYLGIMKSNLETLRTALS